MTNLPLKKRRNCQVCKKSFSDGRALGDHMRSHTRKVSASNAESTSPSLKTSNNLGPNFMRPNETVLMRSVHTKGVGVGPKPDLKREDGVRGKRKLDFDLNEVPESELTADEEGALILVAMPKGERPENSQHWNAIDRLLSTTPEGKEESTEMYIEIDSDDDDDDDKPIKYKSVAELLTPNVGTLTGDNNDDQDDDEDDDDDDDDNDDGKEQKYKSVAEILTPNVGTLTEDNNDDEDDDDDDDADDDEDDDDETYSFAREKTCKKKYVCDICGKVLHSKQELGGHQTSHRIKRLKICDKDDQAVVRQYDCEICGRVFESGQALGGHKKGHNGFK